MLFRSVRATVGSALAVLAFATPSQGATCAVPGSYATIAAAMTDPGCTTVQIAAGTYHENLFVSHSVTIQGAGQSATIIDGSASGRVVDVGPGLTVQISDLTVQNGMLAYDNGAGIRNGSVTSPTPAQGSNLTLTRVTVTGSSAGDGSGGGIMNNRYSTLTINHSKVSANQGRDGGGILNVIDSTITINDSVIGGDTPAEGNVGGNNNYRGFGGGINNSDGTIYINRSVIRNNRTTGVYGPGPGGGICNDQTNGFPVLYVTDSTITENYGSDGGAIAGDGFRGSINVTGSTLSNNTAAAYFGSGGAIWLYNGHALTMANSTISGNVVRGTSSATGAGIGTIALYNATYDAFATLTNVTITNNTAWGAGNSFVTNPSAGGAGIGRQSGVKFVLRNTIVSGNFAKTLDNDPVPSDCSGSELTSSGHNLFGQDGSAGGCPSNGSTDVVPAGPTSSVIDPLADNGGYTLTHKPVAGSPALDAGDDTVSLTTDQTGNARQFGTHVDIGAVEVAYNTPPLANAGGPYAVNEGSSIVMDGGASSDAEQGPSTLTYTWDLDNDGTYETAGQSVTFSAAALDGPSSATIGLRVCDNLGVCATATGVVTVQNVAPSVTATASTAMEGGSVTVSGSLTDPGTPDAHTVVINWGPGNGTTTLNLAPGALTFLATRTFVDDAALSATVTVTDDDGASGSANAGVAVSNVAPLATLSGAATAPVGQPYVVTGTYSDAGLADTHTVTVTWESGSSETFAVSGGTFTASHQYATSGARTITACVTDDDGGSGCATVSVSVANAAAKITGGGLRTANNGRGGFNVQSDGTTISGQLQFQSSLGNFHASRFTSLGVPGDGRSATFAGVGTDGRAFTAYVEDNGEPGRNDVFRLWIDGVLQNASGAMSGGNIQIK